MKLLKQHPRHGQWVGEYAYHTQCRFCHGTKLKDFIDFGLVPLAGGFLPKGSGGKEFLQERKYPLVIAFCEECYLVQVRTIVPTEVLYKNYFYFSSAIGTLVNHFAKYAEELARGFEDPSKRLVVEIGCNDGVFLKPLKKQGFKVAGVDPSLNVVAPLIKEGYQVIVDGFNPNSAQKIINKQGKADVIVSSNSFAHIDDMDEVIKGVSLLLKPTGFMAFEVHYLQALMAECQYDMMYHDHMSYYSLITLEKFFERYDMEIYDVCPIPIHAGSRRFYVQKKVTGKRPKTEALKQMNREELTYGLHKFETYAKYYQKIDKTRQDLRRLLKGLKREGKTVIGYGASGRGTQVMSFCQITADDMAYVVDDAPAKIGAFTPGNHLEIKSSVILDDPKKRPDYVLLFAWSFYKEIAAKKQAYLENGGQFIIPLPKVKVIHG